MHKVRKKTTANLFIAIILVIATSGCRKEGNDAPLSLNEKEYYSYCQLSSISADGDSACFIGNEKGDIYRYNKYTERYYDTLRTGTDRIYNVAVIKCDDDTFYLISVRNSGLIMYRYSQGKLIPIKKFLIQDRQDCYSPYKTIVCGNRIYVATSHGLFYKNLAKDDDHKLERLYPISRNGDMLPFLTTSLIRYGNFIYAASESGLIKCNIATNETEVLHSGEKIKSALLVDNRIYSLSEKSLYIDNNDGNMYKKYDININADIYYHAGDTHYFISSDRVTVAHDCELEEGKGYKTIPLRRNVRPECRNIIMSDSITEHSLLITENALFRIPFHLEVFNTDGKTTAACSGDNCLYFVTNNSLFRMSDNESEAKRIADLPPKDRITNIMFHDNTLYYTNGSSEIKRKHISNSFIKNYLSRSPETIYSSSRGITTLGIGSDGHIYLGIRDSLLLLHEGKTEVVKTPKHPFVNRITINGKDNNTYAALLNGGILHLNGNQSSVLDKSAEHQFIKDIAFTAFSTKPCILTNHFLFSPDGKDSVAADGFSRLLTADGKTFYALMESGIRKYAINRNGIRYVGDTLCDIHFSPSISLVHDNHIYIGATSLGIIELKPDGTSQWVRFNHDVYTPDHKTIIFIFLLECLLGGFVIWYRNRKRIYSEWENIRKNITKINREQAKKLETENPDGIATIDRRLANGRIWIERYETVKDTATAFKQLTELEIFLSIFERNVRKDIYNLNEEIRSRNFVIEECENKSNQIKTCIMRADMSKVLNETKALYEASKEFIDSVDNEFIIRLNSFINECRTPNDNKDSAIERIYSANRKFFFAKTCECIVKIKKTMDHINDITDITSKQEDEKQEKPEVVETVLKYLKELYYMLSQDTSIAEKINIKQRICRENISMSMREKTLMLLIAVPDIKAETAIHVLNHRSINNTRTALSKAKKELSSINSGTKGEQSAQKDSLDKYMAKIAG